MEPGKAVKADGFWKVLRSEIWSSSCAPSGVASLNLLGGQSQAECVNDH